MSANELPLSCCERPESEHYYDNDRWHPHRPTTEPAPRTPCAQCVAQDQDPKLRLDPELRAALFGSHHEQAKATVDALDSAGGLIEHLVRTFGADGDASKGALAWHFYASELKPWLDQHRPGWRENRPTSSDLEG